MNSVTYLSFFTNKGFYQVGSKIVKNLNVADLVALLQAWPELTEFIATKVDLKKLFNYLRKTGDLHDIMWSILVHLKNKNEQLDELGSTALHYLSRSKDQESSWRLEAWIQSLPPGLDRCPVDQSGLTPLHFAVLSSNVDHVEIICKYMIEIVETFDHPMFKDQFAIRDSAGKTALHYSTNSHVHADIVRVLCKYFPVEQIGIKNNYGRTALHSAVALNRLDVLKVLCQHLSQSRYQFGIRDNQGKTALHLAVSLNHNAEMVKTLCSYMTTDQLGIQDHEGKTALLLTSSIDYSPVKLEIMKVLCQNMSKDQLGIQDNLGKTALHRATTNRHSEVVKILCAYMPRCQLGIRDHCGETPLHCAFSQNYTTTKIEMVQLLCQKMSKEQLGIRDNWGRTALHIAAIGTPQLDVIKVLCQFMTKNQIKIKDNDGQTALNIAQEIIVNCVHKNIVNYLRLQSVK